jgi:hypothetical protein
MSLVSTLPVTSRDAFELQHLPPFKCLNLDVAEETALVKSKSA